MIYDFKRKYPFKHPNTIPNERVYHLLDTIKYISRTISIIKGESSLECLELHNRIVTIIPVNRPSMPVKTSSFNSIMRIINIPRSNPVLHLPRKTLFRDKASNKL